MHIIQCYAICKNQIDFQNIICSIICELAPVTCSNIKSLSHTHTTLVNRAHPTEAYTQLSQDFGYIHKKWFHEQTLMYI